MKIIVIPADKIINIDRVSYRDFPGFTFDLSIHAIHWNETSGHVEFEEKGKPNLKISGQKDFEKWLSPYVQAWQAADRLEKERQAEELKVYNAPEAVAARELAAKKVERAAKVDAITVTVGDLVFNGDEESQSRMVRTIHASEYNGKTEFEWVMADDTVRTVTLDQLKEAFGKAVLYQNGLWPYIHA